MTTIQSPEAADIALEEVPMVRRFEWLSVLGRSCQSTRGMVGLGLTFLVLAVAFLGPLFAPEEPNKVGVVGAFAGPSSNAIFGGDALGRDVLSRVLSGGWQIIVLATIATALGVVVGAIAGVAAAYLGGWLDNLIMRVVDVVLAFPQLVFALLLISVAGNQLWLLVVAVGTSHAPQVARVIRAAALDVTERDYVKAVAITGVSPGRVMLREVLPNLTTPLMVESGLRMSFSIIVMAGLAFLGFGFQPPDANWGYMINENRIGAAINPLAILVPAMLLAIFAIGVNTFADAVTRSALRVDRTVRASITADAGSPALAVVLPAEDQAMPSKETKTL
ncbi:peptide/nickel transport system permease protein [Pseudarthrobacter sp. PvP004]|uniref:ABC transporter permease n=1 Tax=Pseudarthrobacter sp. PvP004 TaxID=2817850 RepID=UPI001AE5FAF8|nr:ABC transporter permease [Pseudarthrobacter sp. PvP004]MBP2266290.1 peptide/nickel transport system permease protein [Pseudarthrobacter sp. PvP004]